MLNIPDFDRVSPTISKKALDSIDSFHDKKNKTEKTRFILSILIPTISGLFGVFLGAALTNKKDSTVTILEKQLQQLQLISKKLDSLNLQQYPKEQHMDTIVMKK